MKTIFQTICFIEKLIENSDSTTFICRETQLSSKSEEKNFFPIFFSNQIDENFSEILMKIFMLKIDVFIQNRVRRSRIHKQFSRKPHGLLNNVKGICRKIRKYTK
ncbi:hypothetical protein WA026_009839 [Henosepilachna vigintioctopunctata]|uniref:Uncharacterized protein n=1 Tax=Henosepilachna vigintioctopunctata TaxID=420089 RepID=A0AAW1TJ41_9CUCU